MNVNNKLYKMKPVGMDDVFLLTISSSRLDLYYRSSQSKGKIYFLCQRIQADRNVKELPFSSRTICNT